MHAIGMDSYNRFKDENYKNWLKTAERLFICRKNIREFVEVQTQTFHENLKGTLKGGKCTSECTFSNRPNERNICGICDRWESEISNNYSSKMRIPWNNCKPHLWYENKWEVAKVYMIRGVQKHQEYDDFDISAILNFMSHCKHFKDLGLQAKYLTEVLSVRNKVMHAPDLTLSKEEMEASERKVQELTQNLKDHVPELETKISEEMEQFNRVLEKCTGADFQGAEITMVLDREQCALKAKIEDLTQRYEEENVADLKTEVQFMKDFLDQNKDLLEKLGPQITQINEIQAKVNEHEQQINTLNSRMDQLEKSTPGPADTEHRDGASSSSAPVSQVINANQSSTVKAPVVTGGHFSGPVNFN